MERTGTTRAMAVLWDMDGVIADTAPAHYAAWEQTFRRQGIRFSPEQFRASFGMRNDAIIRGVLGSRVADDLIRAISVEKEAVFRQLVKEGVRPLPGVLPLMANLKELGVKMAIASSAPMENLRLLIDVLGIAPFIQAVVCAQDVKRGKPDPEVFLTAARRLGVEPTRCLVIEDAVAGVRGCHTAGMRCLAVTNSHPRQALAEADHIVDSLEEVEAASLLRLLDGPDTG